MNQDPFPLKNCIKFIEVAYRVVKKMHVGISKGVGQIVQNFLGIFVLWIIANLRAEKSKEALGGFQVPRYT